MRAGISTASLFLRRNNEDALAYLAASGVKTAEVFLTSYCEYEQAFAELLLQRKGEVFVNSVHILNSHFEPQLFAEHERVKADAFAMLKKVSTAAKILGAPYYTFHGTARYKRAARDPANDNFERMGKGLAEAFDACKRDGVTLCLENVEWSTYNRPGVFNEMTKYVPNLRGVLDIKQARISGFGYEEYLNEMSSRIAYAHVSDIDDNGKMCLPGKGSFDFDTFIKRLKDVGFDGAILLEAYQKDYQTETELLNALQYVEELLYKYNCN